ncbi:MAG TPA: RNA degradosome polyphosphate kinase, partial [bacterium]|nr:RNA degradosome polyphosphate kinase [bacterium]
KENNTITKYIHLATGNYNEITAKLYTDLSFFTSDTTYGEDISILFNLLTGFSMPDVFNRISVAPLDLRKNFLFLIERETENAKKGIKAKIIAKMNSLNDAEIVKALYNASMAGVKIELIVRGICILRPNLKKISQNIKVKSIVGQFLEHARIFYFYNGGDEEYYLSSADWMSRNLDKRIEILFPIKSEENKKFIAEILKIQLADEQNSWYLDETGAYKKHIKKHENNPKNYFKEIYSFIKKGEKKNKKTKLKLFSL